jgi:hypothetical protein
MGHKAHKKIHKKLSKHTPQSIEKARKIFSFKYPKLLLLIIITIFVYYIFSQPFISEWMKTVNKFGYFGIFFSGIFTSLGFTTPLGVGLLIKINPQNIFIGSVIGGIGATIADLLIFKTIKFSFIDEFKRLGKTKFFREIGHIVKKNKSVLIRHYLLYVFAGILLATPLPDEVGVSMLAGLTTIKPLKLAIISFILHTLAIFALFLLV